MEIMKTLILNDENRESVFAALRKTSSEELLGEVESKVRDIIKQVRKEGDQGLLEITHRLEGNNLKPEELMVSEEEFEEAKKQVNPELVKIIEQAIARVRSFHQAQIERSWLHHQERGMVLGQLVQPLEKVGIYVPGGKAEYPSSLIMGAVPALLAGVKEIIVVSPSGERRKLSSYLLVTAQLLGISKVYKVGGAQAIAALAYGTETISMVNKIVGPGNIYVTMAKKQVFGQVDIDMLAGPSEILIWAEEGANPDYIVADLCSQAEHDEQAYAVLVTTSASLAQEVAWRIEQRVSTFPRKEIILSSLTQNGKIIVAENESLIVELINSFAPEHLELQIDDPWSYLGEIKNFGAVFLGPYAPEPLGDYWAGPNHILPTGGSAKYFSVLSVSDFLKRSSVIYCSKDKLQEDLDNIARFADLEGLSAHAHALRIRK